MFYMLQDKHLMLSLQSFVVSSSVTHLCTPWRALLTTTRNLSNPTYNIPAGTSLAAPQQVEVWLRHALLAYTKHVPATPVLQTVPEWLFGKLLSCEMLCCRRDAFTMNMLEIPQGAGSGFIWDESGQQL
jgi:hypothetical protein